MGIPFSKNKPVQMYPVYRYGSILGQTPFMQVPRSVRDEWIDSGAAVSVCRRKAIQLTLCLPPGVQPSQAMGPSVAERAADGSKFHQSIIEAWMENSHPGAVPYEGQYSPVEFTPTDEDVRLLIQELPKKSAFREAYA